MYILILKKPVFVSITSIIIPIMGCNESKSNKVGNTENEDDMLDLAFGLTHPSRVGCQILITDDLDGLVVSLPSATRNMLLEGA